jgi:hypothetical protein
VGRSQLFLQRRLRNLQSQDQKLCCPYLSQRKLLNIESNFLENATKGKVYAKFYSMDDATANKELLEKMVRTWIKLKDK